MNRSEIENCVAGAKNGNRDELLKIIEQYKPFIVRTTKAYRIKNYDFQDLLQIGYTALIKAVEKYKTGSNAFSTYAYTTIENALRYTARQNNRYEKEISLFAPVAAGDSRIIEYIDHIEAPVDFEEDFLYTESISEVRRAVSKLPPEEAELVNMVYYRKCSLNKYADVKGISYGSARRKKSKVLNKLGSELGSKLH
jgi:RNA polymerase sporulation-specific sigma factor